jgi:hypothetical protein
MDFTIKFHFIPKEKRKALEDLEKRLQKKKLNSMDAFQCFLTFLHAQIG